MPEPDRLNVVFHIGMGKTGSTSIQRALRSSEAVLAGQNARYIGMWFDMLSPTYHGLAGEQLFFREPDDVKQALARDFIHHIQGLRDEFGATTFVMSNESLFSVGQRISPFLKTLTEQANVRFVLYVRDPKKWLPSAYAQWGMAHKTKTGPLRSFSELAPELLQQYQSLFFWHEVFAAQLAVRSYDDVTNAVADFSETIGLRLEEPARRFLERPQNAELALRAFFNSKFESQVLPDAFSEIVPRTAIDNAPSLSAILSSCFDHRELPSMLGDAADVVELLRREYGVEFDPNDTPTQPPSSAGIKDRVIDLMINILLDQAARLDKLEKDAKKNVSAS